MLGFRALYRNGRCRDVFTLSSLAFDTILGFRCIFRERVGLLYGGFGVLVVFSIDLFG